MIWTVVCLQMLAALATSTNHIKSILSNMCAACLPPCPMICHHSIPDFVRTSVVIQPSVANMATRPCFNSASRSQRMSMAKENPIGSKPSSSPEKLKKLCKNTVATVDCTWVKTNRIILLVQNFFNNFDRLLGMIQDKVGDDKEMTEKVSLPAFLQF